MDEHEQEEEQPELIIAESMAEATGEEGHYDLPPPPAEGEEPETERIPCLTAFLVVVDPSGSAYATPNCNLDLVLEHAANPDDMYRACAEIQKDIVLNQTAQSVMVTMMQTSQQMAQQQQAQKLAARLQAKGMRVKPGPGGMVIPK